MHFFRIGYLAIGCYLIFSTSGQYKPIDVKWDLFGHLTLFAGGMFNQFVLSSWPCQIYQCVWCRTGESINHQNTIHFSVVLCQSRFVFFLSISFSKLKLICKWHHIHFIFYFSFLNVLCPVHHLVGKTPICFLVRNCGSFVALNDVIWEAHNCKICKFLRAFDIWWWLEDGFERLWRTLRRQTSSLVY